jgi:hypothetical protein
MPQTCKRRPGGGGAAVHTLAGDEPHYSGNGRPCHSGHVTVGLIAGGSLLALQLQDQGRAAAGPARPCQAARSPVAGQVAAGRGKAPGSRGRLGWSLPPGLRAIYGDLAPPVHVLRSALKEGRVDGCKEGREWRIDPDLEKAAAADGGTAKGRLKRSRPAGWQTRRPAIES